MKKYLFIFYNTFIVLLLLSTLCICNVFSMHNEEDDIINNTHSSLSMRSPIETTDFISFITTSNEEEIDENYVYHFIQKYIVNREEIPETENMKILRPIIKLGGGIMGGLAGIPYFEVGKKAGGENGIIAWGMGIVTTIAVSGTGSWSYFNLLKNLDPQPAEEKNIVKKSGYIVPAHVSAHGLGLITAVPTAYMAARFNTQKWLAGISYGLEYSLKTNGFLTLFKRILSQEHKVNQSILEEDQIGLDPSLLTKHLSSKIIPTLITMQTEERDTLINSFYQGNDLTVESYLNFLLSMPSQSVFLEETPDTWKKGYPKKAFIGGLCFSSLLNIVHNFHCAYIAWSLIYDHPAFIVPMASISVVPTFILELQAALKTGGSIYDSVFYSAVGKSSPSLAQSLYPNLMKTLPIICASLAGVTSYVGRFMVIDVLHDIFPHGYSMFFSIGGVLGPFLFTSYANYSLVQDLILNYTRSYGEESKKKLSLLIQDIEKLIRVLSLASQEEAVKFLGNRSIQNTLSILNRAEPEEAIQQTLEPNPIEEPIEGSRKKQTWCGIL